MFHKKTKISKLFEPFYAIKNLKFYPSTNHGGRHVFNTLDAETVLVLLRSCNIDPKQTLKTIKIVNTRRNINYKGNNTLLFSILFNLEKVRWQLLKNVLINLQSKFIMYEFIKCKYI